MMKNDFLTRIRVLATAGFALALLALGFLAALGVRSLVAGTASAEPAAPNPGHSWSQIGDLPGTMWHSNNDGSGSGLDADLLDGLDSTALLSPSWSAITNKPAGFADNVDNDVLGGLSCASGQVPKWSGSAWQCGNDNVSTPVYCTWSGKTYSTGAECVASSTCLCQDYNPHKRCESNGSWSDFSVYGCPCRNVCGW